MKCSLKASHSHQHFERNNHSSMCRHQCNNANGPCRSMPFQFVLHEPSSLFAIIIVILNAYGRSRAALLALALCFYYYYYCPIWCQDFSRFYIMGLCIAHAHNDALDFIQAWPVLCTIGGLCYWRLRHTRRASSTGRSANSVSVRVDVMLTLLTICNHTADIPMLD